MHSNGFFLVLLLSLLLFAIGQISHDFAEGVTKLTYIICIHCKKMAELLILGVIQYNQFIQCKHLYIEFKFANPYTNSNKYIWQLDHCVDKEMQYHLFVYLLLEDWEKGLLSYMEQIHSRNAM